MGVKTSSSRHLSGRLRLCLGCAACALMALLIVGLILLVQDSSLSSIPEQPSSSGEANNNKSVVPTRAPAVLPAGGGGPQHDQPPSDSPTISGLPLIPNPSPHTQGYTVSSYNWTVILQPNSQLPLASQVSSPNQKYEFRFEPSGDLELWQVDPRETMLWQVAASLEDPNSYARLYLQGDGNLVLRQVFPGQSLRPKIWSSETFRHAGATLVVDDGGQVALVDPNWNNTYVWLAGIPRDTYAGSSSADLTFPIRATFYYPWFPETWSVNGNISHFVPILGPYNSGNPSVARHHVDSMDYAHIQLSVASWWGPNTHLDRPRLGALLDETLKRGSSLKWTIYHEVERLGRPSVQKIRDDLDYLLQWYAWHPAWAHVEGKPVIFVYNSQRIIDNNPCDTIDRWMTAAQNEWFVVLKWSPDFEACPRQPNSWHQYGPSRAVVNPSRISSFGISAGFWRAQHSEPTLPRLTKEAYATNVRAMMASGRDWQLITTFNEAGEGTLIESCPEWASESGYGIYLDALHENPPL